MHPAMSALATSPVSPTTADASSRPKKQLKQKVVQIYETFFRGEDPSLGNAHFWDELFLLKVNGPYIEKCFEQISGEHLMSLKRNVNMLFYKCVATLDSEHQIKVLNAMLTLAALIRGTCSRGNLSKFAFDSIDVLTGFDAAEFQMQMLLERLTRLLSPESATIALRSMALKLLLVLVTATDNVSENALLEYVMITSVFESIVQLLGNPLSRQQHGYDAVFLLTVLVNYRKYESVNPYIVKLSILDDELALTGYGQVVSSCFMEFNRKFTEACKEQKSQGWMSSITNMVGSMFVAEEGSPGQSSAKKETETMLLALYEAVHLNRNFITTLTHSTAENHKPPTSLFSPTSPSPSSGLPDAAGGGAGNPTAAAAVEAQPTNLLVTFLEYSSIVLRETKDEHIESNAKLCMIILTCITEDQYANSLMHDLNMNFRVQLHRTPMRHRKNTADKPLPCRPLACAVLDLMVEFIMSHLLKGLPAELYIRCLSVTHRILCYQKKCRVRLHYPWKELWNALINLLKFLLTNETGLLDAGVDIFKLALQVVTTLNLFITYGDTFLPSPAMYDQLYYELIRMHQVFDNLYSMALTYASKEDGHAHKEKATRLNNHLVNIRAIVNHFSPKIDQWASVNHLSALTEEQVLEVVRSNYDTLTLKLQESLDQFDRYSEKPKEASFFTQLVRSAVGRYRKACPHLRLTQEKLLAQYSSI